MPSLLRRIDRAAKHLERNRSSFMTDVLEDYLDRAEAELKMMANPRLQQAFYGAFRQPGVLKALAESLGHELTEKERQQVLAFMQSDLKENQP